MIGPVYQPEPRALESDSTLAFAESIERQIQEKVCGRIYNLQVDCLGDTVVLQGWCRTYHVKQLAHEAALDAVEASTRLENLISVC